MGDRELDESIYYDWYLELEIFVFLGRLVSWRNAFRFLFYFARKDKNKLTLVTYYCC